MRDIRVRNASGVDDPANQGLHVDAQRFAQ
jgi:hypothetical protein